MATTTILEELLSPWRIQEYDAEGDRLLWQGRLTTRQDRFIMVRNFDEHLRRVAPSCVSLTHAAVELSGTRPSAGHRRARARAAEGVPPHRGLGTSAALGDDQEVVIGAGVGA